MKRTGKIDQKYLQGFFYYLNVEVYTYVVEFNWRGVLTNSSVNNMLLISGSVESLQNKNDEVRANLNFAQDRWIN